eukprot:5129054-Amphidinium_carterae.1
MHSGHCPHHHICRPFGTANLGRVSLTFLKWGSSHTPDQDGCVGSVEPLPPPCSADFVSCYTTSSYLSSHTITSTSTLALPPLAELASFIGRVFCCMLALTGQSLQIVRHNFTTFSNTTLSAFTHYEQHAYRFPALYVRLSHDSLLRVPCHFACLQCPPWLVQSLYCWFFRVVGSSVLSLHRWFFRVVGSSVSFAHTNGLALLGSCLCQMTMVATKTCAFTIHSHHIYHVSNHNQPLFNPCISNLDELVRPDVHKITSVPPLKMSHRVLGPTKTTKTT